MTIMVLFGVAAPIGSMVSWGADRTLVHHACRIEEQLRFPLSAIGPMQCCVFMRSPCNHRNHHRERGWHGKLIRRVKRHVACTKRELAIFGVVLHLPNARYGGSAVTRNYRALCQGPLSSFCISGRSYHAIRRSDRRWLTGRDPPIIQEAGEFFRM